MTRVIRTTIATILATSIMILPVGASAMSPSTLISLTNQQRAAAGLAPLYENAELDASAYAKAQDMLANQYWAHYSPSGTSPWYFMRASGYQYSIAGENLAMDFDSDQAVMDAWMNSPEHRANLLNPNFQDVGIAEVPGVLLGDSTILVVAHYGAPLGSPGPRAAVSTPAPTSQPKPRPQPVVSHTQTQSSPPPPQASAAAQPQPTTPQVTQPVKPAQAHVQPTALPSQQMSSTSSLSEVGIMLLWLAPVVKYRF